MSIKNQFEQIRDSTNPNKINDFIITLTKEPQKEHLNFVDFFIEHFSEQLLNKIKINLVYLIGVLSHKVYLEDKYLKFLVKHYYTSDRWVRNEIIKAFKKIAEFQNLEEQFMDLISNSLKEEYVPIIINALDSLWNCDALLQTHLKNILFVIDHESSQISTKAKALLKREVKSYTDLFQFLNEENSYKRLNKPQFRALLLTFFDSVFALEEFKTLIVASNWDLDEKNTYLRELETFEKILLRKSTL
ncbi:MAG: hypothetical protein BAJALOKI1v1_1170004 [Promethearchaeota archaeon]|nr:MAG: hypothetical protein BAJALOKI1v1_1170004 [Candidatus Lokiarchaeota archaeon]